MNKNAFDNGFFSIYTGLTKPSILKKENDYTLKINNPFIQNNEIFDERESLNSDSFDLDYPGLESPFNHSYEDNQFDSFYTEDSQEVKEKNNETNIPDQNNTRIKYDKTIFNDNKLFTWVLYQSYVDELKKKGLNPDFAPMLVAQDALESGWGKKPKGHYNFGNIAAGDKGHGFVETSSGHKFTNYTSIDNYVKAKINLLNNDRYRFFNSGNSNNVSSTMQTLANKGYCPNSPQYGQKVAQIYRTVLNYLQTPIKQNNNSSTQSYAQRSNGNHGNLISIDIEDLLKQEGITEINGKKIRFGNKQLRAKNASFGVKNSHHKERDPHTGNANARDISIPGGTMVDYTEFRRRMLENPRIREWFKQKNWGIINEVTSAALKRTNGTGPHFHFGPDKWARRTWNHWLTNPTVDVTKIISAQQGAVLTNKYKDFFSEFVPNPFKVVQSNYSFPILELRRDDYSYPTQNNNMQETVQYEQYQQPDIIDVEQLQAPPQITLYPTQQQEQPQQPQQEQPQQPQQQSTVSNSKVNDIVNTARKYLGWKYISGGKKPETGGFDCCGLLQYVFNANGVKLPAGTVAQFKSGTEVPSLSQAKVGDIICTPGNGYTKKHVKMISKIENGKIWTIEAKGKKYGVVETPLTKTNNIITIRRIVS